MMAASPPSPAATLFDLFSLVGKTAIVTGGTGGLGHAMTLALAEAGADIISIEMPDDPLSSALHDEVHALGREIRTFSCNVGDSQGLRAVFSRIRAANIVGDILLNGAGIQRRGKAEELDDEAIDAVFAVNLKATFVAGQEFARHLIELDRPGKIINVASIISFISSTTISPYAAAKGAVLQTTKAFSSEWAAHGIQVNCICPGYFRTTLTDQYSNNPAYSHLNEYILSRTPAGRWGNPQDLRGAIIFLASKASDYVTGTSIVVDGGMLAK